jgi:hypothetical protein
MGLGQDRSFSEGYAKTYTASIISSTLHQNFPLRLNKNNLIDLKANLALN